MGLRERFTTLSEAKDSGLISGTQPPVFAEIVSAAQRISEHTIVTPLHESAVLNHIVGGRVLLKCEALQRTGSFKFRGAYNFVSQLNITTHETGVVAYSSGNHAQGVAAAAAILGIPALIVMPADAPSIKLSNTRAYGAEIRTYDRNSENREEIAATIARQRGAVIVPPYDHGLTIAGQGTVGLEFARQAEKLNAALDTVACPCGGGGLIAGIAIALQELSPKTQIYAIEPEGFDNTGRSILAGERLANTSSRTTICDALMAPMPGSLTYSINQDLLTGGLTVSDDEVREAMGFALRTLKLVLEPGGAVALAALLAGGLDCHDKTVCVVLSGGNVDQERLSEAVCTT